MSKKRENKNQKLWQFIASIAVLICIIAIGQNLNTSNTDNTENIISNVQTSFDLSTIPEYTSIPYIAINNNIPYFTEEDYTTESFEKYSDLDEKGRCRVAYANICKEIMPPDGDQRGDISSIKPTGWVQRNYNGEYLYNRCHLIGHQLSDEDANELNLITGTRYFNVNGMLPFENKVADYIEKHKNNHVLYRVTPIFKGNNKLASGVEIEAYSVEDRGKEICFNVYVYNVQPGITINYETGESEEN